MVFKNKKVIQSSSLGDKLKEARADLGVSLDRASKDLNIALKYLVALENNQPSLLPGEPYLKNFLQLYCQYLHLDFSDCQSWVNKTNNRHHDELGKVEKKYLKSWPRVIRRATGALVVIIILIFLVVKIEKIFAPPLLEVFQPQDGLIVQTRQLEILGQSEKETEIIINNKQVLVDDEGIFKTIVDLQKGYNFIKITASKRYGRSAEKEIKILLREE